MTIAARELAQELIGRRAYLTGFHEALRRARERAAWVREHEKLNVTAAEVAPFVMVQLSVWVAQYTSEAVITPEERAFRHGFGDAARALEGWSAIATDAFGHLDDYAASGIIPWVNARPTNFFDLRLMPQRFDRERSLSARS
ncbi:MAG: hypothetical protein KGK34_02230 [Chloroflexota bacterium]|nr:hypothetical protein [Chloroflexota bacterium]